MQAMWLSLLLVLGLLAPFAHTEEMNDMCEEENPDEHVYLFGYGKHWGPYEYLDDKGELMGFGLDITRSICKIMKKKCAHAVYYDYGTAWDETSKSISLNNRWYDALVNWVPTPERVSAYSFFGTYAHEPASYLFIRRGHNIDTLEEVKTRSAKIGWRSGFRTNDKCLEKFLGVSLAGRTFSYEDNAALEKALTDRDVDVIFIDEIEISDMSEFERIPGDPIRCATGGMSTMVRKDMLHMFPWYDEGLMKLKMNGDYQWLCKINSMAVDPGCMPDM